MCLEGRKEVMQPSSRSIAQPPKARPIIGARRRRFLEFPIYDRVYPNTSRRCRVVSLTSKSETHFINYFFAGAKSGKYQK